MCKKKDQPGGSGDLLGIKTIDVLKFNFRYWRGNKGRNRHIQ